MGCANAINLSGMLCNLWTLQLSISRHHQPICQSAYRPSISWLLIAILVYCGSTCRSICWSTLGRYGSRCISRHICWHVGQHSMACWPTCRPIWWNIARLLVDYQSTISDILVNILLYNIICFKIGMGELGFSAMHEIWQSRGLKIVSVLLFMQSYISLAAWTCWISAVVLHML